MTKKFKNVKINPNVNFWPTNKGKLVFTVLSSLQSIANFLCTETQSDQSLNFIYIEINQIGPVTIVSDPMVSNEKLGVYVDNALEYQEYAPIITELLGEQ